MCRPNLLGLTCPPCSLPVSCATKESCSNINPSWSLWFDQSISSFPHQKITPQSLGAAFEPWSACSSPATLACSLWAHPLSLTCSQFLIVSSCWSCVSVCVCTHPTQPLPLYTASASLPWVPDTWLVKAYTPVTTIMTCRKLTGCHCVSSTE